MTCSLVAVADLIPPEQRGKYQGILAGVYGVASIVGPVVGGFITDHFSWNGIFLLNVPIAFAILLLIVWVFPSAGTGRCQSEVGLSRDGPIGSRSCLFTTCAVIWGRAVRLGTRRSVSVCWPSVWQWQLCLSVSN